MSVRVIDAGDCDWLSSERPQSSERWVLIVSLAVLTGHKARTDSMGTKSSRSINLLGVGVKDNAREDQSEVVMARSKGSRLHADTSEVMSRHVGLHPASLLLM